MAKLALTIVGNKILNQKAAYVPKITKTVQALIKDMFTTMEAAEGIGLAAPQINISKRIIVVDTGEQGERLALINPKITESSSEKELAVEGCLSLPGLEGEVLRPTWVRVEGVSPNGKVFNQICNGLLARVLQHEIDHLMGILFIDRLSPEEQTKIQPDLELIKKQWPKHIRPVA